jgi:hypothetical protein
MKQSCVACNHAASLAIPDKIDFADEALELLCLYRQARELRDFLLFSSKK